MYIRFFSNHQLTDTCNNFLPIVEYCAINTGVQIYLGYADFTFSGYIFNIVFVGSYGSSTF